MTRIHYNTLLHRLLSAAMLMALPLVGLAMTPGETYDRMNEIKLDETMIYGEGFGDSKDMAYGKAMAELMVDANELREAKGIDMLQVPDLQPLVKELYYSSGGSHTVLVYIPLERMYAATDSPAPAADYIIAALCGQDNWPEIKGLLSAYKDIGQIRQTGYCTSAAEVPGDAVAILVDDMYGILSILSPSSSPRRINYRTGRPDSENNYPNCKVIVWYR